MASKVGRGNPPKHTQFKKGQPSANPLGGKLHNKEMRIVKNLTEAELIQVASFLLKATVGEIKQKMKNPHTTVLEGMVLGLALKAITRGDNGAFDSLMNRLLGKVKDNVNFSGTIGGTSKVILQMPANGSEVPSGGNKPTT